MLILAIDCAGSSCGVCVWQDGAALAGWREDMARGQDARLMPMIVEAMRQAGKSFADLDKIAVTRGPGSFTGLRVGLAAARGIGLAAGKTVLGIDRFRAYRHLHAAGDLLVVLESKRAELFCRYFSGNANHQPELWNEGQIADFIAAHPGMKIAGDRNNRGENILAACAELAAVADAQDPAFAPRPLYLRAPDVSVPRSVSK